MPLVAATSPAIYSWGGGALHQISIAALVLALGMLVDNAIVIAENVQWRLDRGESKRSASVGAVRDLAVPLAGATGTTLAAFVPMLMAEGSTAVFTRAIPVVFMDLLDAMRRGADRPVAAAAGARAEAAEHAAGAERRAAFLPGLGVSVQSTTRDRTLSLVTPIGSFAFGDKTNNTAGVEVVQPIFDASRMIFGSSAAKSEAAAAQQSAQRARRRLAAAAGFAYLELIAIDARAEATRSFVESLDARLTEVEAMVDAGRVLQADSLKIRLALEQAQQDLLALREGRVVAESALAQAVGHDGSVAVDGAPDWSEAAPPGRDEAFAQALEHRSDLTAQTAARDALSRRHAAVNAEILPRVDARARWAWSDGSPYAESNWLEGIVTVTWSPFAAGTRSKRAAAIDAQVRAADAEIVEARRSIQTEVSAALAAIETARAAVKVGNRAVEQASETARVERERHTAGRATTNDLLDAEASLRSQHTRLDLARLDLIRAWTQLGLATEGELASWTAGR